MSKEIKFEIPKPEIIESICEKENLLDSSWLFNTTPWSNFDNKCVRYSFEQPIDLFVIVMNGYDTQTAELKKISFDNVIVTAFHGTVNNYTFDFRLGEDKMHMTWDERSFAYSAEDVKKRYIEKLEANIKGLEYQINYKKVSIEKINELNLDN
jgi:hypothetical protein